MNVKILAAVGITGAILAGSYMQQEEKKVVTIDTLVKPIAPVITKKEIANPFNLPEVPRVTVDVPTPVKAIQFGRTSNDVLDRSIGFSKKVPPGYVAHSFDKKQAEMKAENSSIGKEGGGRLSAYLRGEFIDVKTIESKLKDADFDVLVSEKINESGTITSIVFTDKDLVSLASKTNRGFVGTLRILVDADEKTINITSPIYVLRGFLQDDFDKGVAEGILAKLVDSFPGLKNSTDLLKYQIVDKYQFMTGMPYYEDMISVAKGSNLLSKVKKEDIVFSQKLENGSTLLGIKLKIGKGFTDVIGKNNAGMLPYPVLIENGEAKILDPKYYISFMYPMLSMSKFMEIQSVPDDIVEDCENLFI